MTANVNVTKVLFKRGNTAQNAAYTGINGEITVDTQAKTLRIHDGVTAGGNVITAGGVIGAYSNTNAAAYIPTDPTITSLQSNAATQAVAINTVNANIGAFQTYANANAATQATGIDTINANLGSFQTYANIHFGDSNYGNTNVAAYLSAFDGNIIPSANVTYSLGDATHQWKDLWVSNNTIYIGNTPIRVDGSTLLVNGAPVSGGSTYGNANVAAYLLGNITTGNIKSGNLAAIGDIVTNVRHWESAGANLYIWFDAASKPDVVAIGAFGNIAGWTVSVSDGNSATVTATNPAGYFSISTDVGLTGSGNLTFTSPGYQGETPAPMTISSGPNTWTFGTDGNLTLPGGGAIDGSDYDVDITAGNDGVSTFGHISFTANGPNGLNSFTYNSLGEINVVTAGANDGLIKWVGNSSGDGNGYTTMVMVPDTTREGTDQYIIIDPTGGEPGHIHIRAGGTQDSSAADLYLGGELTCVRVSDTSGIVTVRTTNIGDPNITMDWSFQPDGNLYFPGIGNNSIGESEPGLVVSSDNSVVLQSNNTGESKELLFGTNGDLTVPSYINFKGNTYIGDEPGSENPAFRIVAPLGYGATIETDSDIEGNSWTWTFGVDGTLGAPGDITAVNFIGDGSQLTGLPDGTAITNGTSTIDIPTAGSNIYVGVDNVGSTEFTVNGINTLNLVSLGNVSATKFTFANGVNILSTVGAAAGNISVGDGRINFVASSSGDGNGFSTIEIRPDDVYTSNQNYLIIDPTAPNHIHIRAGGEQDNSQAELYIGGENSYFKVNNGTNPDVSIAANSYVWTYSTDGNVTFPSGGSIIFDSSATSVIDGISSITFADATTQTTAWTGTVDFGNTIAIGYSSATVSQGGGAVAVGSTAGNVSQGVGAVAIGEAAGTSSQGTESIAIGKTAGEQSQGAYSIAIGSAAAYYQQRIGAIAIGTSAGSLQQGNHAIAIGTGAGSALQGNNSIILNATGSALEQTTDNTFTVKPIRNASGSNVLYYNATTGEITYDTASGGTYGNTEVAAYLPTYTGNVGAGNVNVASTVYAANIVTSGTSGNISGVNVISANTFVFAANGVNILSAAVGGTYGNTEVAAYLLTWPNIDSNILDATSANITTLRTANFNSANAVISGGYISALTNASITTATITTLNSTGGNVTTLRVNNFGTANAVITGGYINSLANLSATTAVFTNFSTGNAVINGGYISSLTNASITTSVVTNFSTANAVITGGYASGLANVTATGNVTAGNLIGYGSNTNIVAGAYTSTFDNVGNVILPNAYVSGNTTVMGIAPGYAPNRPAFRIYGSSSNNWTTANVNFKGSDIVVDYNQGSYFDSTTGIFTAPVAGLYSITLNARIGNNNGQNQIMVLKNAQTSAGNVAVMWECDTNTGTAVHYGVSSVMKLAAGDFLTANITVGTVQFDANDSWTVTYIG